METVKYTCKKTTSKKCKDFMAIVLKTLNATNALDKVDAGALYLLEGAYDTYVKCGDIIDKNGLFYIDRFKSPRPHPALNERHKAMNQALSVMKELGLTIKSRSRMPDTEIVTEELSALDKYFQERLER